LHPCIEARGKARIRKLSLINNADFHVFFPCLKLLAGTFAYVLNLVICGQRFFAFNAQKGLRSIVGAQALCGRSFSPN
jgi:hypothetical protein